MQRLTRMAVVWLAVTLVVTFAGCVAAETGRDDAGASLQVTVSILPQRYIIERIGGERVAINVMVGPGDEPHAYEPKPEQLRALAASRAYFRIGVEFEDAWMDRFRSANPDMLIVDMAEGIERIPLRDHVIPVGEPPGDHDHAEGEPDPHIWLSPTRVTTMVGTVRDALSVLDPAHADEYAERAADLLRDVRELDDDIRQTLSGLSSRAFLTFHPAWGYFADDYALEQFAVEIGGQEPSPAELASVIRAAREHNIRVVFAQPTFSTRSAETIAEEIDGRVVLIDPLAEDWLNNMRDVAATFASVLADQQRIQDR